MDKTCTDLQWCQPAIPKSETSKQVEGYCGETPTTSDARQYGKTDDDKTQLD
jgi:hypothetical protein